MTDSPRDLELLRASERRYRSLVERSPVAMLAHREGAITLANAAAAELFRASSAYELLGRDLYEHLAVAVDDAEDDATRTATGRLTRLDGSVIHVELTESPSASDGEIHSVLRDVHERREFEGRVHMIDRMVSIGTLAAGVAHEVNTPLAYVLSNLEFGLDELMNKTRMSVDELRELREALLEAYDGASRMRDIVRDLRTFSRADDVTNGPVDVLRVLESSINMTGQEIRQRAKLYKHLESVPSVVSSESRLGQVFMNLLLNAAQAVPSGAPEAHSVTVTTRRSPENEAVVEVSDTGYGIAPEVMERIFEPFFTTKPSGTGTGLGLSICRSIVEGAGGRISVDSTPGAGTTFRVVLPGVARAARQSRRPSFTPPVERARVLAVDDDAFVGRAIARVLRGHDVVTVESGADALERLLAPGEHFDLILCDLMMPGMTGRELYEVLEEREPDCLEGLVFMSGGTFTPEVREFAERKDVRVIDKPFDGGALRALVQHALRH
ncbi:MAG: response regulator [Deltaproteobacteria bacterium]|nr:response regulator [Deltaproteobacteria bacterium]